MNYSLFPNHYHLSTGQHPLSTNQHHLSTSQHHLPTSHRFPGIYQEPYAYYPYAPYSQMSYGYFRSGPAQPIPVQPGWTNYHPANTYQGVDIILIAILILVSLDLIFVRPAKK